MTPSISAKLAMRCETGLFAFNLHGEDYNSFSESFRFYPFKIG
jgi:hypothetical protein